MKWLRATIFACLLWGICVLRAEVAVAQDSQLEGDTAECVLLLTDYPVRIHFHIWIDGQPFRKLWSEREDASSSPQQTEANQAIVVADGFGNGGGDASPLFRLLDADGDQRLTATEIEQGWPKLRQRDFDGNGLIGRDELLDDEKPAGKGVSRHLLWLIDPQKELPTIILQHYDRNGDGVLTLGEEISPPPEVAKGLTSTSDRSVNGKDIAKWLQGEPDFDLGIALGRGGSGRAKGRTNLTDAFLQRKLDGGYRISFASVELVVARNNQNPAEVAARNLSFKDFDADKNDYLDETEVSKIGSAIRFEQIDADRDGKVTAAEFYNFVESNLGRKAQQVMIEVTDRGFDLLTMLDENQDGFLSERELRKGIGIAHAESGSDGPKAILRSQIPRQITLEIGRGGEVAQQVAAAAIRAKRPAVAKIQRAGPDWFQKMDHNGDGDVDRDEFLGTLDDFQKLDANGDGLISADEASAAKPR